MVTSDVDSSTVGKAMRLGCSLGLGWKFVVSGLFCLVYFVQEKGEDVSKVRYVGRTAGVMAPKRIGSVGIGRVDPISL